MNEENTTTDVPAVDDGAQDALPNEQTVDTADNSEAQVTPDSQAGGDDATTTYDEEHQQKLNSFAKGQGIEDLSELSEREQKLLKVAYDNNANFQRNRQKATQLEKSMTEMSDESASQIAEQTGQDPELIKRLQRIEVQNSVREFWDENPDAKKYEGEMAKIAQSAGLYGSPEAILKASYAMAQANDTGSVERDTKRKTLEGLAQKQQASVPRGNATSQGTKSSKITPQNVDSLVAQNGYDWYMANQTEINSAMAG